jgi:hypothetical protein
MQRQPASQKVHFTRRLLIPHMEMCSQNNNHTSRIAFLKQSFESKYFHVWKTLEEIDAAFQMDLRQPPISYNVWLDQVNLTAW